MSVKTKALEAARMNFGEILLSPGVKKLAAQIAAFAVGFLSSRGMVFGHYAPFGVAAVAAAPYHNMFAVLLGALLGYFIPSDAQIPVRYIAAVLAASAIRWTLSDLVKIKRHPVFAPFVAFAPLAATGAALSMVNGSPLSGSAMYLAESLLAGGGAYFLARTAEILYRKTGFYALKNQEIACVTMSVGLLVTALSQLSVGGVSIGRILAVTAILLASRYGGASGGAIAGIAAGVSLSLSTTGVSYLSGAYALGGLMAGIFSPLGKLASAIVFILANGIASLQIGNQEAVLSGLYEVAFATVAFMLIPTRGGDSVSGMFARPADLTRSDGLRRSVIMKLDYASKALGNVSESVEAVSKKLSELSVPDMNGVYRRTIDETCARCGLKIYCWEKNYNESMEAFNNLSEVLRRRGSVGKEDFPAYFSEHCVRIGFLAEGINRRYSEFLTREAAERRIAQIRSVVAGQFGVTAELLENMSQELELFERFDFVSAQKIGEILRDAGIIAIDVSCRVDKFDRMSIEIEAAQTERARLNKAAVTRQISQACGREFETPCVSTASGKCRIQMSERPTFRAQAGIAQHICGNGKLCGDSYEFFPDGNGRQIALISDGMGTGGRAAVDGAMASGILSTLLKAGIGFDCALKIVNSALMAKGGDESLATIDMAAVDLFSGKTEFLKAGATVTFVRRDGKLIRIDAPSLPIGILNDTGFARETLVLGENDLVVLVSDGAVACGDEWLCQEVEQWKGKVPQELAEKIVSQAIARRDDGHDDDITALVVQISVPEMEYPG